MKPDEIIVVRVSGGLSIGRFVSSESSRVNVFLGGKREIRLPQDRVIFETGLSGAEDGLIDQFKQRCDELSSEIDLIEVWEVVRDEPASFNLEDLADLYWGSDADAARKTALLFYLSQNNLQEYRKSNDSAPRQ